MVEFHETERDKKFFGEEIEELRKNALKMAEAETNEEFKRKFLIENVYTSPQMTTEANFKAWLEEDKREYNKILKESYEKWVIRLINMWNIKNSNKKINIKGKG